ncbi:MAG: TIR domain-containing protein [Candidatus Aegiribacteria sp.]|nr:TIR domain-containing protein [Candidatus Aegiribacteria sp.]MBD3295236.1 TIR domain-containing protein [Candidatus Fermentibacteria bacterium]
MDKYVFVSHSSKDGEKVRRVVEFLESSGVKCWVSYRDIPPGADWAETIYDAIAGASAMVFLHSANVNKSRQIRNELDIATNLDIPLIPLKLEQVQPSKGVRYFTNSHQWLDATQDWTKASHRLIESIGQSMGTELTPVSASTTFRKKKSRLIPVLGIFLVLLVSAYILARVLIPGSPSEDVNGLMNLVAGGSSSWDYATDILPGPDGGFTATGTWDWGFWSEWWVTRFDSTGSIQWSWSDSLAGEDKPMLLPAEGGDVICAAGGYSDFEHTGFPVRVVRLDPSGSVLWDRERWFEWKEAAQPEMASMVMREDSTLHLFFTMRQLNVEQITAAHLITLDQSGNLLVRDTLPEVRTARDLLVLESGDLLRVFEDQGSRSSGIETVSSDGDVIDRIIVGDRRSAVSRALQLPDGNLLLFMIRDSYGEGKGDLTVMRFSPELEKISETTYGGDLSEGITDAVLLESGDVIAAGWTSSWGDGSRDGWLIKLDQNGERLWQQVVDAGGNESFSSVSVAEDGSIWTAGVTSMSGAPDAWIMHFTPDGAHHDSLQVGVDIFCEDWEKGYLDQTLWDMGFNRNYSPVIHYDSTMQGHTFDANNVPVVSMKEFTVQSGLCLSVDVMVPDMPDASGSNWLAMGFTRSSVDDFHLDPGTISDAELKWIYTPGSNDQRMEIISTTRDNDSAFTFAQPESLWLERGSPQVFRIEFCEDVVNYCLCDSLFHQDSISAFRSTDSLQTVRVYLWGSSSSLVHHMDNIRVFHRRW